MVEGFQPVMPDFDDLHEAEILANRIALMEKGRIVFLGTPAEFKTAEIPLARAYLETVAVAA